MVAVTPRVVLGVLTLCVLSLAGTLVPGVAHGDTDDLTSGQWSGGVGTGFLTNTPDGVETLGERVRVDGREFDLHTNVMPGFYLGVRF
jgi:hypothetical protein